MEQVKYTNQSRQEAIVDLITRFAIKDQAMLIELLNNEHGLNTTQTVISRDLAQLGIAKIKVNNQWIYQQPGENTEREILRRAICKIVHNEALIVIHTLPGMAAFVGDQLDMADNLPVLGTLAGENVVFVTPNSINDIELCFQLICQTLYYPLSVEENKA